MADVPSRAEDVANRGEQGQVYKITKLISGKYRGATDTLMVDKQGRLLATEAEQEARLAEHFSEVLNRPSPTIEAEVQDPDTDLDVSTALPEKEEIMTAIRSLDSGKAPGQDSLNAELFKIKPEFAEQVLQPVFAAIFDIRIRLKNAGNAFRMPNKKWKLFQCSTKIKTVPELRTFHYYSTLRMLEDDLK